MTQKLQNLAIKALEDLKKDLWENYYVESNHIRIQVDIHGGLKDASGKVEPFKVYAKILLS